MKYVVNLNGKNYEVEVTESDAVLTNVSDAPVAAPPHLPHLHSQQQTAQR